MTDQTRKVIAEIEAERLRQVFAEGWTPEHDDEHSTGELADAAAVYAATRPIVDGDGQLTAIGRLWPWELSWFKPHGRRRDLIKAAALIAAEIERLDRLEGQNHD